MRMLLPRQARPRAHRLRHGGGAGPACCAQAFRASFRRKKRASPHRPARYAGPPARTSRQEVRRARGPGRSIVAVGAGRALRSFRSPPAGRFGPSAQVPTGHALPSGALRAVFRIRRHARRIRKPCASKATLRRPPPAPKGSVCPVGTCAKRKATRRREQIQGLRAASAQNADICEGSETMSAPKGSVSPVGCCAKRKATRRRTAKRAVGAPRALRDD